MEPCESSTLHLKLLDIQQAWNDMVEAALSPLHPTYFSQDRDDFAAHPKHSDKNPTDLSQRIDKVMKSCQYTFKLQRSGLIEKNQRKNAQTFI